MLHFLKKYGLGLFVLDRKYDIVIVFEPTKYNESITPRALYCVFDNHHIYKLNDEIESLAQIVHNKIMKIAMGKKYDEDVEILKLIPLGILKQKK